MKAVVKYVDFHAYKRVIVISDIHADVEGFQGVLNKVRFGQEDALVIVGDILEKGKDSLKILHLIMEMYQRGNLYLVAGNNDTLLWELYQDPVPDEAVCRYMNNRKYSLFKDMADQLHLSYETVDEVAVLREAIETSFSKEIEFLESLPHILDCPFATFVHAGLKPGNLEEQDMEYCLAVTEFATGEDIFEKSVIVGHWPSSNYSTDRIQANIYRNPKTNVISLDGGNSMKRWRQINYLILDGEGNKLEEGYYDNLPKIKVLEDQAENEGYYSLIFPNTAVEIRGVKDAKTLCYVPWLDKEILLDSNRIYEYKGKTYCSDMTTYNVPVKAGEILSSCGMTPEGLLIKRDGVVGNYHGAYEIIS